VTVAEHEGEQLAEVVPVLAGAVQVGPGGFGEAGGGQVPHPGATLPRTASEWTCPAPRRRALAAISAPDAADSRDGFPRHHLARQLLCNAW
jgi:hypothetical protein